MIRTQSRIWASAFLLVAILCEGAIAQSISVSRPAVNDTLRVGSLTQVLFASSGGVSATKSLQYSTNGGLSWSVFGSVNGGNSYTWEVPNTPTHQGLVKVLDQGGVIGISGIFHIIATGTVDTVVIGGGPNFKPKQAVTLNWTQHGPLGNRASIDISYDGAAHWLELASDVEFGDFSSCPFRMPDTSVSSAILRIRFSGGAIKQTAPFSISSLDVGTSPDPLPVSVAFTTNTLLIRSHSRLDLRLRVSDVLGRTVLDRNVATGSNDEDDIDLSLLAPGTYFYSAASGNRVLQGKFFLR